MKKSPDDYGAVALQVIGKVPLDGGNRETLIARRNNGSAHICALLLQGPTSGHARHAVNLQGTALDRLKYAGHLGEDWHEAQPRFDAGEQFRTDWHEGRQEPNVGMRYMPGGRDGAGHHELDLSPKELAHYEDWKAACRVLGHRYADTVISTCCFDIDPRYSLLPFLLKGLDILAFKVYA